MREWPLDAERELWSDLCYPGRHPDGLWWFIRIAWGAERYLQSTGELQWLTTTVHRPFLRWLQTHILDWKAQRRRGVVERRHLLILLPRGYGKSVSCTKAADLWSHLDEPNMTSYIGGESLPKAKRFLGPIAAVMDGTDPHAWFAWLYGSWKDPTRKWTQLAIVHGYRKSLALSEPSFGCFGVETGITGSHPLMVWYDDPISEEKLREAGQWMELARKSVNAIYPALRTDSLFAIVCTRYGDDDVAGDVLRRDKVASWEGMPSPDKETQPVADGTWHVYFLQARNAEGDPTLPQVWSDAALRTYERRDPPGYAAQMMNDPAVGEHAVLTREQLRALRIPRKALPPVEYATVHLDLAVKDSKSTKYGTDETAIVTWLHDLRPTGILYLDGASHSATWRIEQFYDELLKVLRDLRRRNIRVRAITDEIEVGGKRGTFKAQMEAVIERAGLRVPEIIQLNRAGRSKEMRIRTAAGFWVEGYVRLCEDARGLDVLTEQMLRIGFTRLDDIADAAADVWLPETIWRRPHGAESLADEPLYSPGDEVLKGGSWRGPVPTSVALRLYDEQHAGVRVGWDGEIVRERDD